MLLAGVSGGAEYQREKKIKKLTVIGFYMAMILNFVWDGTSEVSLPVISVIIKL